MRNGYNVKSLCDLLNSKSREFHSRPAAAGTDAAVEQPATRRRGGPCEPCGRILASPERTAAPVGFGSKWDGYKGITGMIKYSCVSVLAGLLVLVPVHAKGPETETIADVRCMKPATNAARRSRDMNFVSHLELWTDSCLDASLHEPLPDHLVAYQSNASS
jgi:hypothetical protein